MKKFKSAAMGFVAGALCMVSVTAFAAYSDVTAKIFQDVSFTFDGTKTAPPSDQPVLNYNGYTYVPLRYVAETLGATVDWNAGNRVVNVQADKKTYIKEVEVEKIVYVEKGEEEDDRNVYNKLPTKLRKNDHLIEITGVSRDPGKGSTKFFLNVENKATAGVQIMQDTAKLTVDGEEINAGNAISWDANWDLSYVETGEVREGYLLFSLIDEDYEKVALTFDVRTNEGTIETFNFYFKK